MRTLPTMMKAFIVVSLCVVVASEKMATPEQRNHMLHDLKSRKAIFDAKYDSHANACVRNMHAFKKAYFELKQAVKAKKDAKAKRDGKPSMSLASPPTLMLAQAPSFKELAAKMKRTFSHSKMHFAEAKTYHKASSETGEVVENILGIGANVALFKLVTMGKAAPTVEGVGTEAATAGEAGLTDAGTTWATDAGAGAVEDAGADGLVDGALDAGALIISNAGAMLAELKEHSNPQSSLLSGPMYPICASLLSFVAGFVLVRRMRSLSAPEDDYLVMA